GLYRVLTDSDYDHPAFVVSIAAHGGQVNAVSPTATAQPHRDSVLKLLWGTAWANPGDDAKHFAYIRRAYSTVYASTGGVPVLGVRPSALPASAAAQRPRDSLRALLGAPDWASPGACVTHCAVARRVYSPVDAPPVGARPLVEASAGCGSQHGDARPAGRVG